MLECMIGGAALAYALLGTVMLAVAAIWICLIATREYCAREYRMTEED